MPIARQVTYLIALRRREITPRQAIASGKVKVERGDPRTLECFVTVTAWSKEMLAALSG